jgi:NAD(P)H-hydrate epimerase
MKVLNAEQIRAADKYTIENEPIKSIDLMERAATKCVEWITDFFNKDTHFKIVCGTGNNGGDGLAIARLLHYNGYSVEVYIAPFFSKASDDFNENKKLLKDIKEIKVADIKDATEIDVNDIKDKHVAIIDALLGSGLSKPVEGELAKVIQRINTFKCPVIAVDIPSGLMMEDNSSIDRKNVINATFTLTFQTPKLAFFFADNAKNVGEWFVLDIGLSQKFIAEQKVTNFFATEDKVASMLKTRTRFGHKGTYGHALLVCGSYGKIGAAVLSAKGCLRAGVGLLTVTVPKCGYQIMQIAVPEAMVEVDNNENEFTGIKDITKYNAIGVGPGIGTDEDTAKGLKMLIQNSKFPLVLDADALNILAENKTWLSFLPPGSILTPHPGEFQRLVGKQDNNYQTYLAQKEFARKYQVYVVLKGAYTATATPNGDVFFNSTGNPGMATGGSGDTLTGIITGLLAQGYAPNQAALLGVYLHGLAGDIAVNELGQEALIAEDISNYLGRAFKHLWGVKSA